MQAIRARAVRYPLIDAFLETGHAWEKQNSMISILRTKEYKTFGTRRDRDRNALLVFNQNENRWTLRMRALRRSAPTPRATRTDR